MSRGDAAATAGAGSDESASREARRLHDWVRAGRSFSGGERHCFFRNTGDGTFENRSAVSGLDAPDDGRAVGLTDWDGDGDLDVWIANRSGPQLRFFENRHPPAATSLVLRLEGRRCNRDAIGARIVVEIDGEPPQVRTLAAGSGFLAQSSKAVHVGLGNAESADVVVHWPRAGEGGSAERFEDLAAGGVHLLVEGEGAAREPEPDVPPRPAASAAGSDSAPAPVRAPTELVRAFSATRVPLPRLGFTTFEGDARAVPAEPERPLLVNLWAGWCAPCLQELAALAAARERLAGAGVDVLALSVDDDDGVAEARDRLAKMGFPHSAGRAPAPTVAILQQVNNRLFDRHRPLPLPSSFLVAPDGRLAAIYKGPVEVDALLADVARLPLHDDALRAASLPFPGSWVSDALPVFRPYALAVDLVEGGHLVEAVDYVERTRAAMERDPAFPRLLARLGNEWFTRGRLDEAVRHYREALARDATLAAAHLNLGVTLNRLGERDAAESSLRQAVELAPESALAVRELAMNLANQGRSEEAVPLFRQARHLDPDDMTAAIHLARVLIPTNPDEAVRLAQAAATATEHRHPNVLAILADAQAAAGATDDAIAAAEQALTLADQHGLTALAADIGKKLAAWRAE